MQALWLLPYLAVLRAEILPSHSCRYSEEGGERLYRASYSRSQKANTPLDISPYMERIYYRNGVIPWRLRQSLVI